LENKANVAKHEFSTIRKHPFTAATGADVIEREKIVFKFANGVGFGLWLSYSVLPLYLSLTRIDAQ
jgi:hypothetical protein